MGDPMTTGLHTTGFLVEKGFDHIPAAVFAGDTYRKFLPKAIRGKKVAAGPGGTTTTTTTTEAYTQNVPVGNSKSRRRRSADDFGYGDDNGDGDEDDSFAHGTMAYSSSRGNGYGGGQSQDDARYGYATGTGGYGATYPSQYSANPPRQRPEYTPRGADKYYPPHPPLGSAYEGSERSSRRIRDDEDAYYNRSVARRPQGAVRRTSSFNGREAPREKFESAKDNVEEAAEKAEHHLREDFLTKSPEGLAVGGLGAIVGGFLAEKVQVKGGREERSSGSFFLTGLGAVVGGLAANAAVDHFQHKKGQNARQDARWEKKWGEPEGKAERKRRERRNSESRGGDRRDMPYEEEEEEEDDVDYTRHSHGGDGSGRRRRRHSYADEEYDRSTRGGARSEYDNSTMMSGARRSGRDRDRDYDGYDR